jgi:hypothetical protein
MSIISPAITHIFYIRNKNQVQLLHRLIHRTTLQILCGSVRRPSHGLQLQVFFRINSKFCWPRHHARPWAWKWNGPREWWAESIHTTHGRWSFSKFVFLLKKSTFFLLFSNLHTYIYVLYTCWTCSVCILPYRSALSYVVYGPAKKTTLFRL